MEAEPGAAYACNGVRVDAERFYAVACDPRRSVVVEACAGAGKTWMLVSRVLRALLEAVDPVTGRFTVAPQEILAITFTRRAAGEMRARLQQWLQSYSGAPEEALRQELRVRGVGDDLGSQALSDKARLLSNLYRLLLEDGRQVQIRTFHSWFAALLRTAPLSLLEQLGLPADHELLEDDAPARALLWPRFYQALTSDDEPSRALRTDFEAAVAQYGRSQTLKALASALDKRIEFELAHAAGAVARSVASVAQQFPEFAAFARPSAVYWDGAACQEALWRAARAMGQGTPGVAAKAVELEQALQSRDAAGVQRVLMTQEGSPRKFNDRLVGIEQIRLAQRWVQRVLSAEHQHEAWLHQQRMMRLSVRLFQEYAALKRERGWVDMNDLEHAARVLLGDPVLSGWVQQRLDARIRHVLVDEFQDTNPLQWQALHAWLSSYSGAGGGAPSVFIVGDPKQSIYRFRRAEPQVFRAAQDFVREGLGGDLLSCDHTRRNAPAVLAVVNAVMTRASLDEAYPDFRAHTTGSGRSGQLTFLPQVPRDPKGQGAAAASAEDHLPWRDSLVTPQSLPEEGLRVLEARQAARWVASSLARWRSGDPDAAGPADIMVLARRRAALEPVRDELRRLGIAAHLGDKMNLGEYGEVQDIVALLDVLVSPQHHLSLARVLKSPLFGIDDAALGRLAQAHRAARISWFDLLSDSELKDEKGRGLHPVLMLWKGWLDRLPPHDALQAIYDDGDVLARYAAAAAPDQRTGVLANLQALLAVALQHDGGRFVTPYRLVRALKAQQVLAPADVPDSAVRLLTIHGAKGLEARTVILLDSDASDRQADTMTVLVDWPGAQPAPRRFVFLASESHPPDCSVDVLAAERTERAREEINALYVALTRAAENLVVSSIEAHSPSPRSPWARLQAISHERTGGVTVDPEAQLPDPAGHGTELVATPEGPACLQVLPRWTAASPPRESEPSGSAQTTLPQPEGQAEDVWARVGQAMHRLLEWGSTSDAAAKAAAQEFALNAAQRGSARQMAQAILTGEGAWAWDPDCLAWAGNEVVVRSGAQWLRLDRLVQRRDPGHEGHWWVLDHKSAARPADRADSRAQLRHYRAAVRLARPGAVVHAAFLTGQGRLVLLPEDDDAA